MKNRIMFSIGNTCISIESSGKTPKLAVQGTENLEIQQKVVTTNFKQFYK